MDNICISGGAIGADKLWGLFATKNEHKLIHYIFEDHKSNCNNLTILTDEQLSVADKFLHRANNKLKRSFPCRSKHVNDLLRRNYYQIKDTDSVYALSSFKDGMVQGGTAWAVQMFIDRCNEFNYKKNCFVFDMETNEWYKYIFSSQSWEICGLPPKPSGRWTGIGSRKITDDSILELIKLFDN